MEKQIKSFNELKPGDLLLIDNPLIKDDVAVVSTIFDVHKYPISDSNGRKSYMKDRKPVYADQNGETGDEMIKEWGISSSKAGDYNFREDDTDIITIWNIRLIDNTHPKWDQKLSNSGKSMGSLFNLFGKFL